MPKESDFAAARAAHVERVRRALGRHRGACVASHASAAIVHRLAVYRLPAKVTLTRTSGSRRTAGRTDVRVAALPECDITHVDGIPVTSPARTVVDIARSHPFLEALVVADSAMSRGLRPEALTGCLVRMWNWPGILPATRVARHADGKSESPLESYIRGRCILLGLPLPQLQHRFDFPDAPSARVDFYWEEFGVVGEADGRVKYQDAPEDVLWDEKRRRDALEERVFVIRWRWAQAHAPDDVFRARLLEAFARGRRMQALIRGS